MNEIHKTLSQQFTVIIYSDGHFCFHSHIYFSNNSAPAALINILIHYAITSINTIAVKMEEHERAPTLLLRVAKCQVVTKRETLYLSKDITKSKLYLMPSYINRSFIDQGT